MKVKLRADRLESTLAIPSIKIHYKLKLHLMKGKSSILISFEFVNFAVAVYGSHD